MTPKIEYRHFQIIKSREQPERWTVIFEREIFHFDSLEEAKSWVDFVAGKPVNYNSILTC